jgi:hypothetical protein
MESFGGIGADGMGVLRMRIDQLQQRQAADNLRQQRPPVPEGTHMMMWDELQMDHALLVKWHEACWRAVRQPPSLSAAEQQQPDKSEF